MKALSSAGVFLGLEHAGIVAGIAMVCAEDWVCATLQKSERTRGDVIGQNFSSGFSDRVWIACVTVAV